MNKSSIEIYHSPEGNVELNVKLENETVWLNRQQMSELFNRDVKTIGKHINNALNEELAGEPVVAKIATTRKYSRVEGLYQEKTTLSVMGINALQQCSSCGLWKIMEYFMVLTEKSVLQTIHL